MSDLRFKDDPTATYRGYRRQSLYCLFRLFDEAIPDDFILQPEGHEDLALYDNKDKLIEVVQVKDHSDNLTASKFKPVFYKRISEHCKPSSSVVVRIVSFGPVGPEFSAALDNSKATPSRVLDTLTKDRESENKSGKKQIIKGLSVDVAERILTHTKLTEVKEEDLTAAVLEKLKNTVTAGDPERAFENLMWWLVTSSEKRLKLTRAKVIEKLNQVGTFLSHLSAFSDEWNTSIIPITVPDHEHIQESLDNEFFLGGRVRIEHIATNLDVRRNDLLNEIHSSFEKENVVIVRGASGQGKTTLAYRYILDLSPRDFRFEVLRACDLRHARRMATAIAAHSEALDVPTLIYIDVHPGDKFWVELVRTLLPANGIRVLVTIREEDWFRSGVGLDDFRFVDLPIHFEEAEGREIYDTLRERTGNSKHLDFDDAWAQLGERKTLFEFVYLITQTESLAAKINKQIVALQDSVNSGGLLSEELRLLRLVAVASAFEARVNLSLLVEACNIPEPQRTLERFNNEFLLRTSDDGQYVEGFHAIRSELITSRLIDPILTPWSSIALQVLRLIEEEDFETFLLCSFSRRPESRNDLVSSLRSFIPNTWLGVCGVSVALQWLGLDNYTRTNARLLENVRTVFGGGWWFTLDWDLAQAWGKGGNNVLESLRGVSSEFAFAADAATTVRKQQTNKDDTFVYFREWIENLSSFPEAPHLASEFLAFATVMYWVGHLGIESTITQCLTEQCLDKALDDLPIHLFAQIAITARAISNDTYSYWYEINQEKLEEHIRRQARIISLSNDDDCLVGHYLIDLDKKASALTPWTDEKRVDLQVNELSVERVEIISRCIPGYIKYGVNGYGHRMSLLNILGDDSEKRMPIENITMPWLPSFNSLAIGLVELRFRPENWNEYFQNIHSMRRQVLLAFNELCEATQKIHPGSKSVFRDPVKWDECKTIVNGDFFLPKSAVDEWGFVSESRAKVSNSVNTKRFTSVSRLEPYNKAVNEYTRTVGNFMKQSLDSLLLIPHLRSANTAAKRQATLEKAKELGIPENSIHLSVVNGIDACIAVNHLQNCEAMLIGERENYRLDREFLDREQKVFTETIQKWCHFAYPNQCTLSKQKRKTTRSRDKSDLRKYLKSTKRRITASLKKLSENGINAQVLSDEIKWNGQSALWITFDTNHPLKLLLALEQLWYTLVDVFKSDRSKIVRVKAMDYCWERIVLVPLVQGKSLEKQAHANMKAVTYLVQENIENQLSALCPESVPEIAWDQLGLPSWERQSSWEIFDQFAANYGELFYHVDHIADFIRCKVGLDELGEEIFLEYLSHETGRMQPFLQGTLDSVTRVLNEQPEWTEEIVKARPNIFNCVEFLAQMQNALLSKEEIEDSISLTVNEIAEWRDQLKSGFDLLGLARCLWIADSLDLDRFDFESMTPSDAASNTSL